MELDGLMLLQSDEDTSSTLGEASHCGRHSDLDGCEQRGIILLYLEIIIHSTPYMNGGATTRGVFKVHAFF